MPILEHPYLDKFKEEISYHQSIKNVENQKGVHLEWASLIFSEIDLAQSNIRHESLKILGPELVSHEWILGGDEPEMEIEVYVSSRGPGIVGNQLLGIASNTTMARIPYGKSPVGLGHLSIQNAQDNPRSMVWLFYNVCIRISKYNSALNLTEPAKQIQELMERNIVSPLEPCLPKVVDLILSSPNIRVGQTVIMDLEICPRDGEYPFEIDVGEKSRNLDLVLEDGFRIGFEAVEPGQGKVELIIVDTITFFSNSIVVEIDVVT